MIHWIVIGVSIGFSFLSFSFAFCNFLDCWKLIFNDGCLEVDDVEQIAFACGIIDIGIGAKDHEMHATWPGIVVRVIANFV